MTEWVVIIYNGALTLAQVVIVCRGLAMMPDTITGALIMFGAAALIGNYKAAAPADD